MGNYLLLYDRRHRYEILYACLLGVAKLISDFHRRCWQRRDDQLDRKSRWLSRSLRHGSRADEL